MPDAGVGTIREDRAWHFLGRFVPADIGTMNPEEKAMFDYLTVMLAHQQRPGTPIPLTQHIALDLASPYSRYFVAHKARETAKRNAATTVRHGVWAARFGRTDPVRLEPDSQPIPGPQLVDFLARSTSKHYFRGEIFNAIRDATISGEPRTIVLNPAVDTRHLAKWLEEARVHYRADELIGASLTLIDPASGAEIYMTTPLTAGNGGWVERLNVPALSYCSDDVVADRYCKATRVSVGPMRKLIAARERCDMLDRRIRCGEFCPYYNPVGPDLSEQQISRNREEAEATADIGCFRFALMKCGEVDEANLNSVMFAVPHRNVSMRDAKLVASLLQISLKVRIAHPTDCKKDSTQTLNPIKGRAPIELGLIDSHWFFNAPEVAFLVPIRHPEGWDGVSNRYDVRSGTWSLDERQKKSSAFRVIRELLKEKRLVRMPIADLEAFGRFEPGKYPINDLAVNDCDFKPVVFRPRELRRSRGMRRIEPDVIFADFETSTDGDFQAYCISADNEHGTEPRFFWGEHCAEEFLESLSSFSVVLFHNLGFDFNFLIRHVDEVQSIMKNGSSIKTAVCFYKGKEIIFKDSYLFIASPLRDFPEMFSAAMEAGTVKEIYPYEFYSSERVKVPGLAEPVFVAEFVAEEDRLVFLQKFEEGELFDMIEYAKFYCDLDVAILRKGFTQFRRDMRELTGLDVLSYVSLASVSDAYLQSRGCYDGVYLIAGVSRAFIDMCGLGGRVMMARNAPSHYVGGTSIAPEDCGVDFGPLTDLDAVSLYPSAICRMDTVIMGKPIPVPEEEIAELNARQVPTLPGWTYAYLQVEILTFGRRLDFPLIYNRGPDAIEYCNEPATLYAGTYYLQDVLRMHDVTSFRVVRGYKFVEGFNTGIKSVMKGLFERRLRYKDEGNPLQLIIKLLMNSCYGINGLKFIGEKFVIVSPPDEEGVKLKRGQRKKGGPIRHMERHGAYVVSMETVFNRLVPARTKFIFRQRINWNQHFSRPHVSGCILDASKTIMNRVFWTAHVAGISILYQDTDSLQFPYGAMTLLARSYKELFPDELPLIGCQMGQFHMDYEMAGEKGLVLGSEAFFIGKKVYFVSLFLASDPTRVADHIRTKGVAASALGDDPRDMFWRMSMGERLPVPMGHRMLQMPGWRVQSVNDSVRTLGIKRT